MRDPTFRRGGFGIDFLPNLSLQSAVAASP
jgi:hypothetical protein